MSKKCRFPDIRAELRRREQESRDIRKQIHESSGMERWRFWQDKRRYGSDTRDLLLGYAFLRQVPYRTCEAKTFPYSCPYARSIQRCLAARGHEIDEVALEAWLDAPPEASQEAAA